MGHQVPVLTVEAVSRKEHFVVLEISVRRAVVTDRVGLNQVRAGPAGGEVGLERKQEKVGAVVAADPKVELKLLHSGVHLAAAGLLPHLPQPLHPPTVDQDLPHLLLLLHAHHRSPQTHQEPGNQGVPPDELGGGE